MCMKLGFHWQMTRVESTTLNIPISESGTNSSHTHNLVKSQSYSRLKLLPNNLNFMTTVNSMLEYHKFQEINVCL